MQCVQWIVLLFNNNLIVQQTERLFKKLSVHKNFLKVMRCGNDLGYLCIACHCKDCTSNSICSLTCLLANREFIVFKIF